MKRALVLLVLIVLAGVAGVIALVPKGGSETLVPVLDASPGDALTRLESGGVIVEAAGGRYLLRSAETPAWPTDDSRVRAAWRVLQSARMALDDGVEIRGGRSVAIEAAGRTHEVRLGSPVAGTSAIEVTAGGSARGGSTDGDLHAMFEPASMRAWRTLRVLPAQEGEWSVMRIESGGRALEMRRTGGRWGLTSPRVGRAEGALVTGLERELLTLNGVRFRDDLDPGAHSDETPVARVVCSRSDGSFYEVRVLGPADADGARRLALASIVTSGAEVGAVMVEVRAADVEQLAHEPGHYLARRVLRQSPADVARLEVECADGESLHAKRTLDGWVIGEEPAGDGASAVARVLADSVASVAVFVDDDSPGAGEVWTVRAYGLDDGLLVEARIGVAQGDPGAGGSRMVIRADGVERVYEPDETAALAVEWLAAMSRR